MYTNNTKHVPNLSKLSRGANGAVYINKTGKAFKFSLRSNSVNKKEYNIAKKIYNLTLGNKFVPRMYGFYSIPDVGSLSVMNYINGSTLTDYSVNNKSKENLKEQFEKIQKQLKNMRIVHGDLHGGNIIIRKNGKMFLIDFGRSQTNTSIVNKPKINVMQKLFNKNMSTLAQEKLKARLLSRSKLPPLQEGEISRAKINKTVSLIKALQIMKYKNRTQGGTNF